MSLSVASQRLRPASHAEQNRPISLGDSTSLADTIPVPRQTWQFVSDPVSSLSVGILCLLLSPRAGAAVAECAPGTPGGLNPYDARPRASASAPRLPDPILLRQVRQAADRRRRLSLDRDPGWARSCVPKRSPENDRLPLL